MSAPKTGNLKKGEWINDTYEIQFFIGEGAFGEVYRVKHKFIGTQVLKIFKEDYISKTDIDTVVAEAKILAKLTHPNVVRVFEANSFEKEGKKYFFMSMGFVSGENITQLLERRIKLPAMQGIGFGINMLEGLRYVQEQSKPIVHRDINTDNVLLSYEQKKPFALLSDFGLAQSMDQLSKLPGAAGRFMYFAPECFLGTYLPTGDLFAAGVVFYKMLTGLHPWEYEFTSDKHEEIANMVMMARRKQPKKPSHYNPEVPDYVDRAVLTALNLNLEDRYKLASHMLADLKEFDRDADYVIPESKPIRKTAPPATSALNNLLANVPKFSDIVKGPPPEVPIREQEARQREQEQKEREPVKASTFKPKEKGKGFDQIAGMHSLKETLYHEVILPLSDRKLYEQYKVSVPNGMMLYGPPGCGKTFFSRKFAEEISYHFIEIKPSDLADIHVHGTQAKIGKLFQEAKEKAPTLIFIDEIDAMVPSREGNVDHHYAAETNEFLAQMTECNQRGIFIICATNRPEKIDTAILRTGRIEKTIYLPPPDFDARRDMFKLLLSDRPAERDIDYEKLAQKTSVYVSSDITYIVNQASRIALEQRAQISQKHLEDAIAKIPPSISEKQLRKYEAFKNNRTFM